MGRTDDGRRVYFLMPEMPFGAMAERSLVDDGHLVPLPEALGDDEAAAMAVPGMSSWAALTERARLRAGETVLVNGATGVSGRLAVQIARHLGASRIVATGRSEEALDGARRLGADSTVLLTDDKAALEEAFKREFARGVDVVLDYLWGASAETLLVAAAKASPETVPVRFVQIGSVSGANITLPSPVLRSSAIELMGSGIGSVPFPKLLGSIRGVLEAAPMAGFEVATEPRPLREIADAWLAEGEARIVVRP